MRRLLLVGGLVLAAAGAKGFLDQLTGRARAGTGRRGPSEDPHEAPSPDPHLHVETSEAPSSIVEAEPSATTVRTYPGRRGEPALAEVLDEDRTVLAATAAPTEHEAEAALRTAVEAEETASGSDR